MLKPQKISVKITTGLNTGQKRMKASTCEIKHGIFRAPMKRYTHIFFDLDNTLWDFETNSYNALTETFRHFKLDEKGIDFPFFFETYSKHNQLLWDEYRKGIANKKELKRLRFLRAFSDININGIDPEEFNEFYLAEMPKQKHLVEGSLDLLNYLKSKGYLLFIITNGFREVQHKKLEATGLKKYFTKVFISENIKAPKPSKEIFEYALKSANAKKLSSLMVGDDPVVDIEGALRFGMDTVWLDLQNSLSLFNNINRSFKLSPTYHIRSLNELKKIV